MKSLAAAVFAGLVMMAAPAWSEDRASGDRASGDRASGDRASGDRASGDRAVGDRAVGTRGKLTVCLQSNDPPLSVRGEAPGGTPNGFDFMLAQAVAQHLGRTLQVQWFVSRDDPDASLVKDANALLSDGRCQLMAEYPLLASTIRSPVFQAAKLPPFEGATADDRRRWVKSAPLVATRPYRTDALTVVLSAHEANRRVGTLADLEGLKIGVQIATLSDAILMHYGNGRLIEHIAHLPDSQALFAALQAGSINAALVDLRAFDAWVGRHAGSGLAPTGYTHSLAFNMGFVGLASNGALIRDVDSVLADLEEKDAIVPMATSVGLTFLPPRMPAVGPDVSPAALQQD